MDQQFSGAYAWEKGFERSWEGVEEDEEGNLIRKDDGYEGALSRARREARGGDTIKRGMIRQVYLCLDMSKGMSEQDMRPNRLAVTIKVVADFVRSFFDQNPLSQLGLVATRDGRAERITELSSNPKAHLEALERAMTPKGDPSLQNLLELVCTSLRVTPEYGSREAVVLYGSTYTCDPGDIFQTLSTLSKHKIRVSCVLMGAELHIARKASEDTGGDFVVAMDERHYRDAVIAQCIPPPTLAGAGPHFADLVQMGFPKRQDRFPSIGYSTNQQAYTVSGYLCPRCKTKTTDLPSTCSICELPLVSRPHLARSYHHLFPVPTFAEVRPPPPATPSATGTTNTSTINQAPTNTSTMSTSDGIVGNTPISGSVPATPRANNSTVSLVQRHCGACLCTIKPNASMFVCPACGTAVCLDCDMYIHDTLHNCPGCA